MLVIIGYCIVIFSVLGGYLFEGGSMRALVQPFEFMIIGGSALGTFIVANNPKVIKLTIKKAFSVFKNSNYNKQFYIELLSFYYELTDKIRKQGVLSIESDIDDISKSALFSKYKLVQRETEIMEFLCDYLRLIVTGRVDTEFLETLMDEDIETWEHEGLLPVTAITKVSDSFPAFGIVAAVMGVVMTMQLIGGTPEELGEHVATALVGTFLGVLLGYGFTGPVASILENRLHAAITVLQSIKVVLMATVHNLAPTISVEFARKVLYSAERPSSKELDEIIKNVKSGRKSAEAKI